MPSSIGDAVRRIRRERGLKQRDVAERSRGRITESWLASLETGRIKYSDPEKLKTLSEILGTSISELYREADLDVQTIPAASPDPRSEIVQRIIDVVAPLTDDQKIAIIEFIEKMYPRPAEEPSEKKRNESRVVRS
jgi:transcriptional regulator with XRE-family HTH domain